MADDIERPWFEAHVTFEAISRADAETVVDAMTQAVCRGHGRGDDHVCKFQFVFSGPMLIDPDEE